MRINILLWVILILFIQKTNATEYTVTSPNSKNIIKISVQKNIQYSVTHNGVELIKPSIINMELADNIILGLNPVVANTKKTSVNNVLKPVIKLKSASIDEVYNELRINFKNNYILIFRAYNEGVAYRFETSLKDNITIKNEGVQLNIHLESHVYFAKEESFLSMNEVPYLYRTISENKKGELCSLPTLFKHPGGTYVLFTESDLADYPGLWLEVDSTNSLKGTLPGYPLTINDKGNCWDGLVVKTRADYIAKTNGTRTFPWRAFLIADQEKDLITNQLVYLLAKPGKEMDYSWIHPGFATLDWWGRRNLFNVDFVGGVNMETFKYFIDFNSKYLISYFVFDDGWSDGCDIYKTNKNLNLKEIFDYANSKKVGIILWVNAYTLKKDVKGTLDYFKKLGAKGIKVDFFNRDDQEIINLFHEIAWEALTRNLVVDFHGACKPTGLIRTYPNVLTSEGFIEFEQNGVSDNVNPVLDNTLPYIRMVAGPMDYIPGTVTNAQKKEFKIDGNHPVGLGTRAHSMALAVVFESPITMLPDSPSDYYKEDECTSFITKIPVTWDETKVIDAKIGEYLIIARRNGNDWYLSAITDWKARNFEVKLDFLVNIPYSIEIFRDGSNSGTRAIDYKKDKSVVVKDDIMKMNLVQGGGWVARISPK